MGSKRSKKIKKLPELIYGRSLRVEKKIKKTVDTKENMWNLSLPQEAVAAPTALLKKKHKTSPQTFGLFSNAPT
jgi:hypothetical protein